MGLSRGESAERVRETLEGIWKRCRVWQVEEWGEQAKAEPVTFGEVQDAADEARLARVAETLEQAEAYRAENGVLWALVEEFEGRIQEWSDDDSAGIGVGASICGEFLDRVYGLRSDLGRLKKTPAEASGLEEKCSELEALPGIDLLRYWRDEFPRPGVKVLEVMTVEELEAVRAEWWRRVEKSAIWEACRVVARTLGDHRPGEHGCFYVFVEEPDPARFPGVNLRVEAHKTVGEGEVFVHWSEFHPGDPSNECRCVLDNFAEVVTPGVWMDYLLAADERATGVKAEASAKEYARRRESLVADMRLASEGA